MIRVDIHLKQPIVKKVEPFDHARIYVDGDYSPFPEMRALIAVFLLIDPTVCF